MCLTMVIYVVVGVLQWEGRLAAVAPACRRLSNHNIGKVLLSREDREQNGPVTGLFLCGCHRRSTVSYGDAPGNPLTGTLSRAAFNGQPLTGSLSRVVYHGEPCHAWACLHRGQGLH